VEAQKPYSTIITNLSIQLLEFEDLPTLSHYIQEWRLSLWETYFFREFKSKDEIQRSKLWEQQISGTKAFK
jgi:hypothetical protein